MSKQTMQLSIQSLFEILQRRQIVIILFLYSLLNGHIDRQEIL
jgi:hypothetical protein